MNRSFKNRILLLPLGLLFAAMSFNGCSELNFGNRFLDQQPEQVGINLDTVFSKKYYAMQVLTKAYTTLPYGIPYDASPNLGGDLSDALTELSYSTLTYGGARKVYYVGAYSAANESTLSKYFFTNSKIWSGIRYSWLMIENVDRVPDMTSLEKNRAKAEAKVIIATHYSELFRHFGGVPYLDHATGVNEAFHYERLTVAETVSRIVTLIDEALPHLEWKESDENDNGRMTKAYAMALKLRVLLFAASPLFNSAEPYLAGEASDRHLTWYGNYDVQRWRDAESAGRAFMEELAASGVYDLVQPATQDEEGYRKAYHDAYFTRTSSEVLLSVRMNYHNNYASVFCGATNNYAKNQCPTLAFMTLFPMSDGSAFPEDFDWKSGAVDPCANRDPRFYETILTNGRDYQGRKCQLYVGGVDRKDENTDGTGLLMYKFSQDYTTATSLGAVDSWPAIRLPEVYLSYAEAINEANGGPNDTAYDLVNRVRNRVGLGNLPEGLDQTAFREAVLRERACEFGYENVHWFDIVRWKNEAALRADIQGVNMYQDNSTPTKFRYAIFDIKPNRVWKDQWSPKWYLSAIPADEIYKNYGLVQNPGWE